MSEIRVLVADDHRTVAESLAARLATEDDLEIVGVADNGRDAVRLGIESRPDVAVLDLRLADEDGISVALELRSGRPETRFIIITGHDMGDTASRAVHAGASAFLAKDVSTDVLLDAIRGAVRGETHLDPGLLTRVLADLQGSDGRAETSDRLALLTPREVEVLEQLAMGRSQASIAEELGVSLNTVRTHVQNLLRKLGVRSSLQAVALVAAARSRPAVAPGS